ncbi:hypothetical protein ENBRE01_1440 [Enteropsectra breve]|nr:hypothetical protein ENBRE01_1440 [Enteropsectra breve]
MDFEISAKVAEIGEIRGIFLKATKNYLIVKNAVIKKLSTAPIAEIKLERKNIISVVRLSDIDLSKFSDDDLTILSETATSSFASEATRILAARTAAPASSKKKAAKATSKDESAEKSAQTSPKIAPSKAAQKGTQLKANEPPAAERTDLYLDDYVEPIDKNAPGYAESYEKCVKIAEDMKKSGVGLNDSGRKSKNMSDESFSNVQGGEHWAGGKKGNSKKDEAARTAALKKPLIDEGISKTEEKKRQTLIYLETETAKAKEEIKNDPKNVWLTATNFLKAKNKIQKELETEKVNDTVPTDPKKEPAAVPQEETKAVKENAKPAAAKGSKVILTREGNKEIVLGKKFLFNDLNDVIGKINLNYNTKKEQGVDSKVKWGHGRKMSERNNYNKTMHSHGYAHKEREQRSQNLSNNLGYKKQ